MAGGVTIGTAGPVVAAMIGLGVGIDHALLIVTRHRENTGRGTAPEVSVPVAMATAGWSVLMAGLTVLVAILSLSLIGIDFVAATGLASATTVATTLLTSVTLLPALLGFAGANIDRWSFRALHHEGRHEHARGWRRWIASVQRRPWLAFVASLTVLVVLAVPLFSMRLGSGDAGSNPTASTTRQAQDLVTDGFGAAQDGGSAPDLRGRHPRPLLPAAGHGVPVAVRAEKAALMNLLSMGAAYGAVVAVFQWGWLSDVFGQSGSPIESFAPMMLFAVLLDATIVRTVLVPTTMELAGAANWWLPRWSTASCPTCTRPRPPTTPPRILPSTATNRPPPIETGLRVSLTGQGPGRGHDRDATDGASVAAAAATPMSTHRWRACSSELSRNW